MTTVLDTSAVLALLWGEPGSELVGKKIGESSICVVNSAELIAKLCERGANREQAAEIIASLGITETSLEAERARQIGYLRSETRHHGLSLGDRACLSLALALNAPVLTADRAWADIGLDVDVKVIR